MNNYLFQNLCYGINRIYNIFIWHNFYRGIWYSETELILNEVLTAYELWCIVPTIVILLFLSNINQYFGSRK